MKNIKRRFGLLLCLLFINQAFSQNTDFSIERKINLYNNDSEVKEISLKISKNTEALRLLISSQVLLGNITIEIYNPNNIKQGDFSIESQIQHKLPLNKDTDLNEEVVVGNIHKIINNPQNGNWIIKIIPEKAIGKIVINSTSSMKQ